MTTTGSETSIEASSFLNAETVVMRGEVDRVMGFSNNEIQLLMKEYTQITDESIYGPYMDMICFHM
ncbi:protein of unknown function [Xenorhabdus bovienii]|uniref:Uncharacterized protein n=2 Tax=Xenorhabdus bovienii TaxID=40576 RepID=A0A0B6XFP8_XENBV|nr:hypothetical protein XBKB1_2250007 [Xenorhabdus bovienii str. kraussei Becker Underwood]CDM92131.1 protein of unknown function [Xenorhabdus bovienii]